MRTLRWTAAGRRRCLTPVPLVTVLTVSALTGWSGPPTVAVVVAVAVLVAAVLVVVAYRSLRRASRRVDTILREELDPEEGPSQDGDSQTGDVSRPSRRTA